MRSGSTAVLKVQTICAYIQTHLNEELTYADLMKRLGFKRHVFAVHFPKQMGMTVTVFIIRQRHQQGIKLVKNGMRIEEAAYQSGFRTYSHFYKTFVNEFGISPRAYFASDR